MEQEEENGYKRHILENFIYLTIVGTYFENKEEPMGPLIVHAYDKLESDCVVNLGTDEDGSNPVLYINVYTGIIDDWNRLKNAIDNTLEVIL